MFLVSRFEVVKDVSDSGTKSELLIHDSQKKDVGTYTCHVRNRFGDDEGKVKLGVQGTVRFLKLFSYNVAL